MPRAIWGGAISFGLVNIPVKLFGAVSPKGISFHQLHDKDGVRIRMKRVCPADDEEVPFEHIVKGYELGKDRYVVLQPDELEQFEAAATHTIDIQSFADLDEIDPIFYETTYYLAPDRGAARPYRLLLEALQRTGKVAIARVVLRTKEYLAAMRAHGDALTLSTMYFHDEVNDLESLPGLPRAGEAKLGAKELEMAEQLVTSLSAPFDASQYEDQHRARLLEYIEKKAEGEEVVLQPSVPRQAQVVDLVSALQASLERSRGGKTVEEKPAKKAASGKSRSTHRRKSA